MIAGLSRRGARAARSATLVAAVATGAGLDSLAAQSVTVSGAGNTTTLNWAKVPGAGSYLVARRQLAIDSKGQLQVVTNYLTLATVAKPGYGDVLPLPSVLYEYLVSAVSSNGQATPGTPARYPAPAFTTVTNLTVIGSVQATVRWNAAYGVAGYQVWRRTVKPDGSIAGSGQQTPQLLTATSFTDPTVLFGELYEYQVIAVALDGTPWPTPWTRFIPAVAPVVGLGGAGDRVVLTWTPTTSATGYHVARYTLDQTGRRTGGGPLTTTPLTADNFADALPAPALYEYQVNALLPDGSTVGSQPVSYPAPAFTTPVGVAAAAIGLRGVVAWNPAFAATGYQVWRRFVDATGRVSPSTQVGSVPGGGTVWLDGLPEPTSGVEYQVVGLSKDGRAWPSPWVRGR